MRRGAAPCLVLATLLAAALAPAGAAPASPDVLQLGGRELHGCEIGARRASAIPTLRAFCTEVDVPEDWDAPAGRHIALHVALVPTLARDADPDVVVFLDGGPGGAATEDFPAVAAAFAPLRQRRHVLLVDQRGTGQSNALACDEALGLETDKPAPPLARGAAPAGDGRLRRCLEALRGHAAPQFYATTDAVRDLEAVRLALGIPSVDLVGVSYGTRVAQQYAGRYPQSVRTVVLDSPVPNPLILLSEHARNLDEALRARLDACAAQPACARVAPAAYASLRETAQKLRHQPQPVEGRDPETFAPVHAVFGADDLAALVRFYLYSPATSALLPELIAQAAAGQYATLLAQAQLVVGDVSGRLNGGMAASVLCTDDADALQMNPADVQTLLGAGPVREALAACAQWPHGRRPADFRAPFAGAMPVLVLAGQFDPVTPPRYGEQIVRGLAHARLIVAPGQGHAVLGAGCLPRLVGDFVRGADPAALDEACVRLLGDVPAFVDVNGPSP